MEEKKLCEVSSKLCPYFRRFSETAGRGGGEQMSMASIKLDHISWISSGKKDKNIQRFILFVNYNYPSTGFLFLTTLSQVCHLFDNLRDAIWVFSHGWIPYIHPHQQTIKYKHAV